MNLRRNRDQLPGFDEIPTTRGGFLENSFIVEPQIPAQPVDFRIEVEEAVGTMLDQIPFRSPLRPDASPNAVGLLEHEHPTSGASQRIGGREPGDAGANHDYLTVTLHGRHALDIAWKAVE
jgi:hypothetical protein